MFNLSDKELDRLSRKAADAYEVENNTSSWDALEQRLDKELGTAPNPSTPSPGRFGFPFAYTSVIILLVGAGYFLLKSGTNSSEAVKKNYPASVKQSANKLSNNTSTEPGAERNKAGTAPFANEPASRAGDKKPITDELPNEKANSLSNTKEKVTPVYSNKNNPSPKNHESEKEIATADNAGNNNFSETKASAEKNNKAFDASSRTHPSHKNKKSLTSNLTTRNHENKPFTDKNSEDKSIFDDGAEQSANNNYSKGPDKTTNKNKPVTQPSTDDVIRYVSTLQERQPIKHSNVIINDSSLRSEATANKSHDIIDITKKNNRSLNTNRSLEIGVSFAPDLSEVRHTNYANRLGTGVGITLGYQLMNRLSLNTGLIYFHKYYQADDENFHLSGNLPPTGLRIEYVNGSVKMFEIPLTLRYDFNIQENAVFFVNGGVSSYLMQKQDYSYYCHFYNGLGIPGWYKQDYNSPQNFWFSMINLSAGFETSLSRTMSLQIDPYVKIPLKRIGVGNVQLNSYGINFAIKFSPVLKRSRN